MDRRAQIREALEAASKICNTAAEAKRALSPEEMTQVEAHEKRASDLQKELDAEAASAAVAQRVNTRLSEARAAAPESQRGQGDGSAMIVSDDATFEAAESEERKYRRGDAMGALVAAAKRFGGNRQAAIDWARVTYGERSRQCRAMQASSFTGGGSIVAPNFIGAELIELLRAEAKFRKAGARMIPLVGGTATLPKVTGGATSYWGTEGENITPSELTTGQVTLTEKKLTSLVPFSNDLLKNSSLATDRMIKDDMLASAANAEDLACFRGSGLQSQPKGIYQWVGDAGRDNSAGATLANIRTDIRTAKKYLGNNNAPNRKRAWFMHSQAQDFIGTEIVDANSNLVWPAMADGEGVKWNGGTVYPDNNIPLNLTAGVPTTGGVQSELYLVEMTECFIGDNEQIEIELFANATYADATGTLRSGISRDESVIRLIRKMDFALRHVQSAHVTEQITWGN